MNIGRQGDSSIGVTRIIMFHVHVISSGVTWIGRAGISLDADMFEFQDRPILIKNENRLLRRFSPPTPKTHIRGGKARMLSTLRSPR